MGIHTVDMCEGKVLKYTHCISCTNDIRSAVTSDKGEESPRQNCKPCKLGTCCVYNLVVLCILWC